MNAIIVIISTTFSTAKGWTRKMPMAISGCSVRSSTNTNAPMISTPTMMQTHVPTLLQLHSADCCSPKMREPNAAPQGGPHPGSRWAPAGTACLGFDTAIKANAIRATGMFTQKIARQVHSVR